MNKPKELSSRADFNFIRYANCWEDADILLAGLQSAPGNRMLSIGSAGDNSFSLLTTFPSLLVAVDVNPVQLYLIELKKSCFEQLKHKETLAFLGFEPSESRVQTYRHLQEKLSKPARKYWENNLHLIKPGIIHQGKFEKYFQFFCKKILPLIHRKKTIAVLFSPKTAAEQEYFYEKCWNTLRWKLLFRIFFSKHVMGKYGRDPAFLKEVNLSVSQFIYEKAQRQLSSTQAQNNHILHYNLCGNFGAILPHYLRPENYDIIRENLEALQLFQAYAGDAGKKYGSFDRMNLSNIFEYMDIESFRQVAAGLKKMCLPEGRMAYWNLMVPRRVSEILPEKLYYEKDLSQQLSEMDKGFFYNQFIIDSYKC